MNQVASVVIRIVRHSPVRGGTVVMSLTHSLLRKTSRDGEISQSQVAATSRGRENVILVRPRQPW